MSAAEITVGVATCGRPDQLARCLAALAEQTHAAAEVIVVDQAASEAARGVTAAAGLPRYRYLEQPRLGLSASRNLALRCADSAVLAVTDDDCAPDAGWLEAIAAALERQPEPDAVSGPILPLGEAPPGGFAISLRESDETIDYSGRVQPWGVGSGANFAAPVDRLRACGGWDERLGAGSPGMAAEDSEIIYRLLRSGGRVRYEPRAVVRHAWQNRARRMATRWSYGYGIGAFCGLQLGRRDGFALAMLLGYARLHVRPLARAVLLRRRTSVVEHSRALASVVPGLAYGLRSGARPAAATLQAGL